jgi:hypothetical protein
MAVTGDAVDRTPGRVTRVVPEAALAAEGAATRPDDGRQNSNSGIRSYLREPELESCRRPSSADPI